MRYLTHWVLLSLLAWAGAAAAARPAELPAELPALSAAERGRLDALSGQRPRIFLTDARLRRIRSDRVQAPGRGFLQRLEREAAAVIARPEPIEVGALDENTIRPLGRQLPLLAAAYLFAGDPAYLAAARRQLDRVADLRDWADNRDIGAAALLGGMAIAYDWLYAQLSDAERARYRARMARQADAFYRMLSEGKPWWTTDFLQNHNYTNAASLALAAMALHGEHPDTERWLRAARRNFDQVLEQLSPDGASHEGVGYWASGLLSALKYFLAVEPVFGLDAVRASSYFRLAARYRLHMSLPGFVEIADYADSARYEWQGPECQLRALGHIFGDGLAQGLAERIETARGEVQPPGRGVRSAAG